MKRERTTRKRKTLNAIADVGNKGAGNMTRKSKKAIACAYKSNEQAAGEGLDHPMRSNPMPKPNQTDHATRKPSSHVINIVPYSSARRRRPSGWRSLSSRPLRLLRLLLMLASSASLLGISRLPARLLLSPVLARSFG